jgi:hypothetical protein
MECFATNITISKTIHGQKRASQRCVSDNRLLMIVRYGSYTYHKGRTLYYMRDEDFIILLKNEDISKQEIDKLKNIFVIVGEDEDIITVYHPTRTKRSIIKHH